MPVTRIAAAVIAVLFCFCGSWVAAQGMQGNPRNGEGIYAQHCLRCHGTNLDGTGPEGRYLIVPPANLQSIRSRSKTDWELLITISHGVLFTPMHGFRERLTDEQIRDVLSYIRMMAPFDATS